MPTGPGFRLLLQLKCSPEPELCGLRSQCTDRPDSCLCEAHSYWTSGMSVSQTAFQHWSVRPTCPHPLKSRGWSRLVLVRALTPVCPSRLISLSLCQRGACQWAETTPQTGASGLWSWLRTLGTVISCGGPGYWGGTWGACDPRHMDELLI